MTWSNEPVKWYYISPNVNWFEYSQQTVACTLLSFVKIIHTYSVWNQVQKWMTNSIKCCSINAPVNWGYVNSNIDSTLPHSFGNIDTCSVSNRLGPMKNIENQTSVNWSYAALNATWFECSEQVTYWIYLNRYRNRRTSFESITLRVNFMDKWIQNKS